MPWWQACGRFFPCSSRLTGQSATHGRSTRTWGYHAFFERPKKRPLRAEYLDGRSGRFGEIMREPACAISQASWKGGGLLYCRYALIEGEKETEARSGICFPCPCSVAYCILENALLEVMKEELNYIPNGNGGKEWDFFPLSMQCCIWAYLSTLN